MPASFEQLMANRRPQGNRSLDLAAMMAGGGDLRREQLQIQGELQGARAGDAMAQARERQQKTVARASAAQHLRASGQGDLADMAEAGLNPNEFAEASLNKQKLDHIANAWQEATGTKPDLNLLNRMLMVNQGKPETLSRVEGNTVVNPMVTPDQNTFAPTGVGLAEIAEKHAQATNQYSSAGHQGAETDLARARTDEVSQGRKSSKPLSAEEIKSAFGQPNKNGVLQADPKKFEDFLAFQKRMAATDPRYLDSHFALMQHKAGDSSRAAGLAEMADPGAQGDPMGILKGDPAEASVQPGGIDAMAAQAMPTDPVAAKLQTMGASPAVAAQASSTAAQHLAGKSAPRKVVRTGKAKDGTPVVQYDDGSIEAAGQ